MNYAGAALSLLVLLPALARAEPQAASAREDRKSEGFFGGEWYASFGYNREWWSRSDIHVSQPGLGDDFTLHGVRAADQPVQIWGSDLTQPQFGLRIGRFIGEKRTTAVELSLDHSKYATTVPQTVQASGVIGGRPVGGPMTLDAGTFNYKLVNGANHLMINLVQRRPLIGEPTRQFGLSAILKAGAGVMLPHPENTVLGNHSDVGSKSLSNVIGRNSGWWRLDGWTAGVEAGLRFVPLRPFYIELTDKVAYSALGNIPVYQGKADQTMWMNQVLLSVGMSFNAR